MVRVVQVVLVVQAVLGAKVVSLDDKPQVQAS